jgi:putative addiction module CopG family antidote
MSIHLPSDLAQFVSDSVAGGSYASESDVFVEALRLLQRREQLRRDVNAGIEQLRGGESFELDDETLTAFLDDVKSAGRRGLEAERPRSS